MRAAVVQMTSRGNLAANLERTAHWIAQAVEAGAEFVALPENFACMPEEHGDPEHGVQDPDGPVIEFLRDQAKRHGILLAGGTFAERIPGDSRHFNTALLFDSGGELLARYRKIHLFDVDLPGATLRESRTVAPGEEIVAAQTPLGPIGLSVCYDIRFPELYREMTARGVHFITVPSAFAVQTGRDHWEVLLRARAIESQAFVIAPAQCGRHSENRESYGRSMIVDPWGLVLAQLGDRPGVAVADCDLDELERVRRSLPALGHRRL